GSGSLPFDKPKESGHNLSLPERVTFLPNCVSTPMIINYVFVVPSTSKRKTRCVWSLVVRRSSGSSSSFLPHDGIISRNFLRYSSDLARSGKQRFSKLIIIATEVEAPGEAPNKAAIDPSELDTTSVPNSKIPPCFGSFLMTCTRCPAFSISHASNLAVGINWFDESSLSCGFFITSVIKYFVNGKLSKPADSIGRMFESLIDAGRSKYEPFFKNSVENPAEGPKRS